MAFEKEKEQNKQEEPIREYDLGKYKDRLSGVSLKKLDRGLWYLRNKDKLRLVLIIFLSFFAGITIVYSLYSLAYYYLIGQDYDIASEQGLVFDFLDFEEMRKQAPKDILLSKVRYFQSNDGKYDFLAEIENPNSFHHVKFDYCFEAGEDSVDCSESFLLPKEKKYLISLENEISGSLPRFSLEIGEKRWGMIDRREISDWEEFYNQRFRIEIEDEKFSVSSVSASQKLNNLSFVAKNNSAYGYRDVVFNILLFSGGSVVGVNKYVLPEFLSSETEEVSIRWFGLTKSVSDVKIYPNVDILDEDSYLRVGKGL